MSANIMDMIPITTARLGWKVLPPPVEDGLFWAGAACAWTQQKSERSEKRKIISFIGKF